MDSQKLLLPGSIVLAGALVGVGLYFGLSARDQGAAPAGAPERLDPAAAPAPRAPKRGTAPGTPLPPPPPEALPTQPPVDPIPPEVRAAATEQASAALAKQRARLTQECWEPVRKKGGAPAKLTVPIRFLFDAQGKPTTHGVGDTSEPGAEEVVACLRAAQIPISIQPPGMVVGVQLTLTLP